MHMQRLGLAARGNSPCWVQALLLSAMESACGETGTEGSDGRMHAEGVSEGFEFNPGQLFLGLTGIMPVPLPSPLIADSTSPTTIIQSASAAFNALLHDRFQPRPVLN